jgi:hypothetical protein
MSGGAFDYRDNVLFDLKDMVAREIGLYEYGCADESYKPKDSRTLTYMKLICEDLGKLGNVLHSLDWYLSGDTSEEEFIKDYEKIHHFEEK